MAEFKIDRFRYTWAGQWETGSLYRRDDIVGYGGKSYVCLVSHTASFRFSTDINYINTSVIPNQAEPKWILWFDGNTYVNVWTPLTYFRTGEITRYHGQLYKCIVDHTSGSLSDGLEHDSSNWVVYLITDYWTTNWEINTQYLKNDVVRYGGIIYRCLTTHFSTNSLSNGLEHDSSNWEIVTSGVDYKSSWAANTRYKLNDIVKYGANSWICTTPHTSIVPFDAASWTIYIPGLEFRDAWVGSTLYIPGDIVSYGGYNYTSKTHNTNSIPSTHSSDWSLLTTGFRITGEWSSISLYYVGDVVRRHGQLYVAILDNNNQETSNSTYWTLVIPGEHWNNFWTINTTYVVGDLVTYKSSLYRCIQRHIASVTPELDTVSNWTLVIPGDLTSKIHALGDIETFSNDTNVELPVGFPGQVLKSVGAAPQWNTFNTVGYVYYVAPTGIDNEFSGTSLNSPFKTVKYACDFVRAGTENRQANFLLTSNKTWIIAEMYQWMLYQSANNISPFASASTFSQSKTLRDARILFEALSYDLSRGGNSQTVTVAYSYFKPGTNVLFNSAVQSTITYIIASLGKMASLIENAITNTAPFQSFQTLNGIASPITQTINMSYTAENTASAKLTSLINILIDTLTAQNTGLIPRITTGLEATINIKTGTYNEILPIVVPVDTALVGDEIRSTIIQPAADYVISNMFYVRNGSGIRNMTIKGIKGSLGAYNQYLTKRPTGGAFVSLDPGTGPDDASVWITTRSPYIQNVTTFGDGCVGLKVDGTLHNSGNKSVVANDFTQVISAGIGIWCTGPDAITELVSVFSYYGHIGYLAENGGKIRATNGNSSYGDYGTVAEGYDTTETPLLGTITNRNQQAQIGSVFAGQAQNKILKLEFLNAGQNYTSATYSFAGAGINALALADEFRDNSIFEVYITGSEVASGGAGYITGGNQAQSGNATSIVIASNDQRTFANYSNMRIIITSGTGVGQYGYIQAYDSSTKTITVYKESTDTAGWDHVNTGTAIVSILDSTTVYSIEPRVVFSDPVSSSVGVSMSASASWTSVIYGYGKYVAVGTNGFASYSTTGSTWTAGTGLEGVTSPQVGFANGVYVAIASETTIYSYSTNGTTWNAATLPLGTTFSAPITVDNTLKIISYSTSEILTTANGVDWINSSSTGILSGPIAYGATVYVSFASGSTNQAAYSSTASSWTNVTLPVTDTWKKIAYGNGRFIAIASSGTNAVYSVDGITWVAATLPASLTWTDIAYGHGLFYAIASGTNSSATTTDGILWTTRTLSASAAWSSIAIGNPGNTPTAIAVSTSSSSVGRKILIGARAVGRALVASGKIGAIKLWEPGSGYLTSPSIAQFTASITGSVMSAIIITSGTLEVGMTVSGGIGNVAANTTISSINTAVFSGRISGTTLTVISIISGTISNGLVLSSADIVSGTTITGSSSAVFTGNISGTTLTVTAMSSGIIYAGMKISGGTIPAGTYIVSNISGAGINSTWTVSASVTQASTSITGLRYLINNSQSVATSTITGTSYVVSVSQTIALTNLQAATTGSATVTVIDPNATTAFVSNCRIASGVLGNPTFLNRGSNYQTTTTTCTVSGNGFADMYPDPKYLTVTGLSIAPSPGASLIINGILNTYKIVNITSLGNSMYYFQISPAIVRLNLPSHGTAVSIRQKYSQVRLTGHDYLLIGTGDRTATNFPNVDTTTALQAYQVQENNQGRVFVTATDQDGNFKVGGLFGVQQATGIVTISADLFNLAGLNQLTLGGVQIGQNTVTITQFSTDRYFTANSDNIVPTQKAIKAYLASMISNGGANAQTSALVAGTVGVGPNKIYSTINGTVKINNKMYFKKGIDGTMLAMSYFANSFKGNKK